MHIHRQQPLSAGLFRRGEKNASAVTVHSSSLMRLIGSIAVIIGFAVPTQLGDWVLCIVFSQDFKITSSMYPPETTNSEGFTQIAKMTICFSKLQSSSLVYPSTERDTTTGVCRQSLCQNDIVIKLLVYHTVQQAD